MTKINFVPPRRAIERVYIHCSASDHKHHDDIAVIRKWHTNPKPPKDDPDARGEWGRGWSDVGYHYFIRKSGLIEEGRPLQRMPAAQGGRNKGSIAICCHGLEEDKFTEAQFNSLRVLCSQIDNVYGGQVTFHGHCEVSNKTCPVFNYKLVLGLDGKGHMTGLAPHADPEARAPAKSPHHKPLSKSKTMWSGGGLLGIFGSMGGGFMSLSETNPTMAYVLLGLSVVGVIFIGVIAWERIKKFGRGE